MKSFTVLLLLFIVLWVVCQIETTTASTLTVVAPTGTTTFHHEYSSTRLVSEWSTSPNQRTPYTFNNNTNNKLINNREAQFLIPSLSMENVEFYKTNSGNSKPHHHRGVKSNNQQWINSQAYKVFTQQSAVYQNSNLLITFYVDSKLEKSAKEEVCGRSVDTPCATIQHALDSLDYILHQNYSSFLENTGLSRAVSVKFVLLNDVFECYSSIVTPTKQNLVYIITFQSMDNVNVLSALFCEEKGGFPIIGETQRADLQLVVFNGLSLYMNIRGCRAYNYIFFDVSFFSILMAVNIQQNCLGTQVKGDYMLIENAAYEKAVNTNSGFLVYGYSSLLLLKSIVNGVGSGMLFSEMDKITIFQTKFEETQLFLASSKELQVYGCLLINSKIGITNIVKITFNTNEFTQYSGDSAIMADFGTSIEILNTHGYDGESFASIQGFSSVKLDQITLTNNSNSYYPDLKNLVIIEQSYEVTITNSQFLNNRGINGSCLYISRIFKLVIDKSSFIGNEARGSGGAIFVPIFSRSYLNAIGIISNCQFENNTSVGGAGGAIFIDLAYSLNIISCTFRNNIALISGGALYIGSLVIQFQYSGSLFDSNRVIGRDNYSNMGGAIFLCTDASVNRVDDYIWKSATFINNYAKKGGAIAYIPRYLVGYGRFINTKFINNQALFMGAAVYILGPESVDPSNEFIGNLIIGNEIIGTNIPNNFSYALSELEIISDTNKSANILKPGSEFTFNVKGTDNIGNLIPLYYERIRVGSMHSKVVFNITEIGNFTIKVIPYLIANDVFSAVNIPQSIITNSNGENSSLVEVSMYFKADILVQKFYYTAYMANCDKGYHIEKVPGTIIEFKDVNYLYACVKNPEDYTWLIVSIVVPVTILAFVMGLLISLLIYFILRKVVNSLRRLKEKDRAEAELERKLNDKKVIFDMSDDEEESKQHSKASKKSSSTSASAGNGDLFIPLLDNEDQSFIIPIEDLHIEKKIGEGGNGVVYLGKWRNIKVAIKSIKSLEMTNEVDEFDKEAAILSRLHHLNIVQFYGVAITRQNKYMVTEYLTKGSLDQVIYQCKNGTLRLQFSMRISILLDVANGMDYLHNMKPGIIHRDLKPGNILLNDHFQGKVCDFGLVRLVRNSVQSTMTMNVGTLMYLAPESVDDSIVPKDEKKSLKIATKLDVYSFSIIMYELLYCIVPFIENPLTKEVQKDASPYRIPYLVSLGNRPIILKSREEINEWIINQDSQIFNIRKDSNQFDGSGIISLVERYQNLMVKCWNQAPLERPSFNDIINELSVLAKLF